MHWCGLPLRTRSTMCVIGRCRRTFPSWSYLCTYTYSIQTSFDIFVICIIFSAYLLLQLDNIASRDCVIWGFVGVILVCSVRGNVISRCGYVNPWGISMVALILNEISTSKLSTNYCCFVFDYWVLSQFIGFAKYSQIDNVLVCYCSNNMYPHVKFVLVPCNAKFYEN